MVEKGAVPYISKHGTYVRRYVLKSTETVFFNSTLQIVVADKSNGISWSAKLSTTSFQTILEGKLNTARYAVLELYR